MIRILALNEESHSSGSEDENEPTVTKEAQETIAVSEYVRALKLITNNSKNDACILLRELLDTEVLHNVTNEKKDKLFSVKYNCYKNLGFIYIELGDSETALNYLLSAYELDDTDVVTMNKLGQLALRMNKLEIALITFEKCLVQNPNHWPSLDGVLKILCLKENYSEAYGWALLCYSKDKTYKFGLNVILEIRSKFKSMGLEYIESCFKIKFTDFHLKRTNTESVFPGYVEIEESKPHQPDFSEFKLEESTWMSLGQLISDLYKACEANNWGKHTILTMKDLMSTTYTTNKKKIVIESEPQIRTPDDAVNVNEAQNVSPTPADTVSKQSRRRQRKRNAEQNDAEMSINGIMKRILAKYFILNFDEEPIFQVENIDKATLDSIERSDVPEQSEVPLDDFQIATQSLFDEFMMELETENVNILILVLKWLNFMSRFWNQAIPAKLLEMYLELYVLYLNHFDLCTWNLLGKKEFKTTFRMAVFFVELYHDKNMTYIGKQEINTQWFALYNHLIFHSGFFEITNDDDQRDFVENRIRILWLQYCLGKFENDLQRAVDCLYSIDEVIQAQPVNFQIVFPNLKQNKKIDLATCNKMEKTLKRTISLNSVTKLYHENNFDQLIPILKDTIVNQATQKSIDYDSPIRLSTQIEVFLESLWNIELYEECLVWSEKCLKYALDNYLTAPSDTFKKTEWGGLVTYILTYVEALVNHKSIKILVCLDRFYSRLIQSLSKIVVNQLDVPYDKKSSRTHLVSTKLPWILLHHILQRDEDVLSVQRTNNDEDEEDELEDAIPNSMMIFFTAHDFLGRHRLCTNHNGGLLLFTLDVVATRLRSPYMEPFRDIISEYLEQVTYCLYGYPSKKARSKYIEEHDAVNIELDWNRAMQLFDIYRPDNLPEFNSYKNDSISNEHEQLLQRIIVLIPSDGDPSSHSHGIKHFISGNSKDIPQPFGLLPHRVHSIYYLLADYYFKNRDMVRSIKYYILDLTICPTRFDSWAGLALSKANQLEVKLKSCLSFCIKQFIFESEEALRCFQQCFELKESHVLLLIEYGNFAYMMHSFYARNLTLSSHSLSMERFEAMEKKKDEFLKAASNCFNTVVYRTDADDDQNHDERWLYHYMLGKIAEKRNEQPNTFLDHYKKSAKCLYEHNAFYPFRINYSNPQNLSIEAFEIYYRITSSIVKYLEQHSVKQAVGKLFQGVLREIGNSPFALNQAKNNNSSINTLKRKLSIVNDDHPAKRKTIEALAESDDPKLLSSESSPVHATDDDDDDVIIVEDECVSQSDPQSESSSKLNAVVQTMDWHFQRDSPSRRRSQEMNVTTTINGTTATTGSDSTKSSSSESSSESSSYSDSLSDSELEAIYRICIRNLEECVTRFPEHYKSFYRLANIYLNAPKKIKDLKKCRQLLIGTYTTGSFNQIQGLFADRKLNNFFNGIWRIPSSEIDRPESFPSHMSRCVVLLMKVLSLSSDHNILLDLALYLNRNPENDKRYIKEDERKELFQQAISSCIKSFRHQISLIRECPIEKRDDKNHLSLLIDIFKAHQKVIKHLMQKENSFASLLVDGYKVYVEGKLERLPDNVVLLDAAIKLCQCEIVIRKNHGKLGVESVTESSFVNSIKMFPALVQLTSGATSVQSVCEVDSSSRTCIRPPASKNSLAKSVDWSQPKINPAAMADASIQYTNPEQLTAVLQECYKPQAGLSSTSLVNGLENMNTSCEASISSSTTVAQKPPVPSSSVISVPSYSASKSSKNALSRLNEASSINVCDGPDFDIESVIPTSKLLKTKIFSDLPAVTKLESSIQPSITNSMAIPKDLPLTITPAPADYSGKSLASNAPNNNVKN